LSHYVINQDASPAQDRPAAELSEESRGVIFGKICHYSKVSIFIHEYNFN
jgi:hypothetical protein